LPRTTQRTRRQSVTVRRLARLIRLAVTAPDRHMSESGRRRSGANALTALVSPAAALALGLLVDHVLHYGDATVKTRASRS
jgi:hypothetical protein